ncbi:hypothetical protein EDC96DRAFT_437302 [Choanephora cucurbitarum]|nr:hypothetical protein EDC96DRAFT_437302 [Choanephora cucurbitarum]
MAQSPDIATPTAETNNVLIEQPTSIDEAIALVVSGPSDAHAGILKTLSAQQLLAYTSDGLDPLTILNPVNHSLAYLYFITARCLEANSTNGMHLFELLNHFIQVFDPVSIQIATARFALVGKALIHLAKVLNKPLLALQSFKVAIERSSTGSVLTALHPRFLQACISAKAYRFPLDLLNRDIDAIDTTRHELGIQCFLEYYYYGAIVYIANKQYRRALEFLLIAISAPTVKAVSMIQLLAYRKFILVSFIVEGRIGPLPKYTSAGIEKVASYWSPHHISLVKAFQTTDLDLFQDIASKHSAYFESFQELGLLKQCFQSLRRKKIKEMTKVYITVSLEDMANKMGPMCAKELEMILLDMVRDLHSVYDEANLN